MAGSVVVERELGEHLLRVLGAVLHALHAAAQLAGAVLQHGVVQRGSQLELAQVEQEFGAVGTLNLVRVEQQTALFCAGLQRRHGQQRGDGWLEGDDRLEAVINHLQLFVPLFEHRIRYQRGHHEADAVLALRRVHNTLAHLELEHASRKLRTTLLTNHEQAGHAACVARNVIHHLGVLHHRGVDATAEALVGGDWHQHRLDRREACRAAQA